MAVDSLITRWHMSFSRVACIKIIRHLTRRQPRPSPVSVSEEYQQRKNKNVIALVSIHLVSIPSSDVWYCADWWYVTHQCVTLFTHTHTSPYTTWRRPPSASFCWPFHGFLTFSFSSHFCHISVFLFHHLPRSSSFFFLFLFFSQSLCSSSPLHSCF